MKLRDVLHDRVPMLGPTGQTGEDEQRGLGESTQVRQDAMTVAIVRYALYRITDQRAMSISVERSAWKLPSLGAKFRARPAIRG